MLRNLGVFTFICLAWIALPGVILAEDPPPKILGSCTVDQLEQDPYAEWFKTGYDDYTPYQKIVESLKASSFEGVELTLFFGTWCGDSRREVPRIVKLLDHLGLPRNRLQIIALDNVDNLHKRSPDGEEQGFEIYRVPTMVLHRDGQELARIVEYPALSLERDILAILQGASYTPSYASYPVVRRWLEEGLLADPNVSPDGLADQVRHLISSESELHSPARVLLDRGDTAEALKLFQVNCSLHWQSAAVHGRLAQALWQSGEKEQARKSAQRAMRRNPTGEQMDELLEMLDDLNGST